MDPKTIISSLAQEYTGIVSDEFDIPKAYKGQDQIKAIVLGADPTHIVDEKPIEMKVVFDLDDPENSPYWRGINMNLKHIGLTLDNLYVQNVCRNYFTCETTQNKKWEEIARKYWIPYLKQELDNGFDKRIPILMTTQFILWAALEDNTKRIKAANIYEEYISIPEEDNLFKRKLYALYRHPSYSLKRPKWGSYVKFLNKEIS
jgi:hypothetical protein